jgi:hypothetical protein
MFDDWNADHGDGASHLRHAVTYMTLLYGDWDSDGDTRDLAYNTPRRHDNEGNTIADVWNSIPYAEDVWISNQWNKIVVHLIENTPGVSDGTVQVWLNDDLVLDTASQNWFGGYDGGQTWNMIILTDNGGGPPSPDTSRHFWDALITTVSPSEPTGVLAWQP